MRQRLRTLLSWTVLAFMQVTLTGGGCGGHNEDPNRFDTILTGDPGVYPSSEVVDWNYHPIRPIDWGVNDPDFAMVQFYRTFEMPTEELLTFTSPSGAQVFPPRDYAHGAVRYDISSLPAGTYRMTLHTSAIPDGFTHPPLFGVPGGTRSLSIVLYDEPGTDGGSSSGDAGAADASP